MASFGKSFKTNRSKNFITEDSSQFNVRIKTNTRDIIEIKGDSRKKIIIKNNSKIKKLSEHISFMPIIVNTPEEAVLETKINKLRNASIDRNISVTSFKYLRNLQRYANILKQRNIAIKERENIKIWNNMFIEKALKIWNEKKTYNTKINYFLNKESNESFINVKAEIEMKGILEKEQEIYEELKRNREKEIEKGYTIIGPQKDKINYFLNKKEIKANASQGEKTLFYLLLKKAEAELIKEKLNNIEPIILLDDVLAKLDKKNRENTVNFFKNNEQTIITHTEKMRDLAINQININD